MKTKHETRSKMAFARVTASEKQAIRRLADERGKTETDLLRPLIERLLLESDSLGKRAGFLL